MSSLTSPGGVLRVEEGGGVLRVELVVVTEGDDIVDPDHDVQALAVADELEVARVRLALDEA
eukprot:5503722-Prymnesium_polylepis.1